jgi:hypothetical protein
MNESLWLSSVSARKAVSLGLKAPASPDAYMPPKPEESQGVRPLTIPMAFLVTC